MNTGKRNSQRLHIRRCHLCEGVTESEGSPVIRCHHCGKSMAPFYFFDESEVIPHSDVEGELDGPRKPGERKPVRGFTAYW
jgi:hypothetical protein